MDLITVVIVDDHPLFRQGVEDALSLEPDIKVLAIAENGEQGLELVQTYKPLVAIIDINLPGMNGLQLTQEIIESDLQTRVIILTAYSDQSQKNQGYHHGAAAYCSKGIHPNVLTRVVRAVAAGKYWIDDCEYEDGEYRKWLKKQSARHSNKNTVSGGIIHPLTPREMEILTLISRGMSNKEIAAQLGLSHQTVKNHVTAILNKLDVSDRTQAALCALQYGWVRLSE